MATSVDEASAVIRDLLGVEPPSESVEFINLLVYGDPGAGKTFLAGTAQDHPETSPILLVDVEGGAMTLRHRRDVDVVQVRSMKQIQDIQNGLVQNPTYYKTVIVDSLTELQKLDMRTLMLAEHKANPERVDPYVPRPREWGKSGERVRVIARSYRDLPCHVIFTALAGYDKDDNGRVTAIYPSIPGKLRSELPGFFDIVAYLQAIVERGDDADSSGIVRTLQFVKTEKVVAKDRSSSLPPLMKNPSIPLIWEIIQSDSDSDSDSDSKRNSKGAKK